MSHHTETSHTDPLPVTADVDDLTHDGRGVARVDGKAVFLRGALPGERVHFVYSRRRRGHDEGTVTAIKRCSPERVEPNCEHFGICGGCAMQHLSPAGQIASKAARLLENLQRIGRVTPTHCFAPIQAEPWGYRRKARLSARYVHKKGRLLLGFREINGRYVADIDHCPVLHTDIAQHLEDLCRTLESLDVRERIPQVECAVGDAQAAIVIRHLAPLGAVDCGRLSEFQQRTGLHVLLQPAGMDSLHALDGEATWLGYRLPAYDLKFRFDPLGFVQVNGAINERLVQRALELLSPGADARVLDLFCGLGNFSLPLAQSAARVTGVEGDMALVELARSNARENGLDNADFVHADLGAWPPVGKWAEQSYDQVLLDPPRSGAQAILPLLKKTGAARILYVSCDPATLARDAGVLVHDLGFALSGCGVVDMFPHTAHVESIALFESAR